MASSLTYYEGVFIGKRLSEVSQGITKVKGKVHSVFHKVINIEICNELYAIVLSQVGKSSRYVTVKDNKNIDFTDLNLKRGDICYIDKSNIYINDILQVNYSKSTKYEGKLVKELKWDFKSIPFKNIVMLKSTIDRYSKPKSVWKKLIDKSDKRFLNGVSTLSFLKNGESENAIKELIGYGIGLTPSGDDLLLGYLTVLNHLNNYNDQRTKFHNEIRKNIQRTTDISKMMLEMALEYEYHEYLENVIKSVATGYPEEVLTSTKRLIEIGATSGSDMATGIYTALMAN